MTTPATVAEIDAELTGPGGPFEIETIEIDGRPTRTWKHAPHVIGDILDRGCELAGPHDLIVSGDERLRHDTHRDQARRLAHVLVDEFGVRKGDRVAIAMRNVPEWSVAFFAAVLAGAIATPLNAFWKGGELAFALEDAEPRVLIADGERFERLAEWLAALRGVALLGTHLDDRKTDVPLPSGLVALDALLEGEACPLDIEIDSDDLATIFYTSGTTSHPKGVLGTHRNMCANAVSSQFVAARGARRAGLAPSGAPSPRSVVLVRVPLFHGTWVPLGPGGPGLVRRDRRAHAEAGPAERARSHRARARHQRDRGTDDGVGPRELTERRAA